MTTTARTSQSAEDRIPGDTSVMRITRVAAELGVSAQYLRMLEWQGRVPPARRDFVGRIYSDADLALLRNMGIGSRPRKRKRADEVPEGAR